MVAVSVFSGLISSPWALARAAAKLAIDSLDRCMASSHAQQVEADGPRFGAFRSNAMADRLFGILGHQALQLCLGLFVLEVGRSGAGKDPGELRPGIGGAHVDDAHRLNARFWR